MENLLSLQPPSHPRGTQGNSLEDQKCLIGKIFINNNKRTLKLIFPTVKYTHTQIQIHKYTNTQIQLMTKCPTYAQHMLAGGSWMSKINLGGQC